MATATFVVLVRSLPAIPILMSILVLMSTPGIVTFMLPLMFFVPPRCPLLLIRPALLVLITHFRCSLLHFRTRPVMLSRSFAMLRSSHRRRIMSAPLWMDSGWPVFRLAPEVFPDGPVARLVTVSLTAYLMLALYLMGIPVSRILALVNRQRSAARG